MLINFLTSIQENDNQHKSNDYSRKYNNELLEGYINNIALGNMDDFSKLYEETKASVFSYAMSVLKNPTDAEDVLQDTFVLVYKNCSNYKSANKPMAWIITITKNLCNTKFRKSKRFVDVSDDDLEKYLTASENVTPEDKIILNAYLKMLSNQEQTIISLYIVSGFLHKEIADILEIPLSTVLSKYNRSIKKLQKYFLEGRIN